MHYLKRTKLFPNSATQASEYGSNLNLLTP